MWCDKVISVDDENMSVVKEVGGNSRDEENKYENKQEAIWKNEKPFLILYYTVIFSRK